MVKWVDGLRCHFDLVVLVHCCVFIDHIGPSDGPTKLTVLFPLNF